MQLNLPILESLLDCKNLLIAGMGGGFDIFCGLPIYFELTKRGQTVHLANYSFTGIQQLQPGGTVRLSKHLVGITANYEREVAGYFPELFLAKWFQDKRNEEIIVWCFDKTGVRPLLAGYRALVEHLSIDGILLVDGGVDSLVRGNEAGIGTLTEDTISLAAVNQLDNVPLKIIACLGLGAEEDITYKHIFENIADLNQANAFFGSCSLLKQMPAYQDYEDAVKYVFTHPYQSPSVINASVISAVIGAYGDFHLTQKTLGSHLWISPLMPIYWFFDLLPVAEHNLMLDEIGWTDTVAQAWNAIFEKRQGISIRPLTKIPL